MTEVLMHKKTGELALATPVYIPMDYEDMTFVEHQFTMGGFEQIGFMFENSHKVYAVLPFKAKDEFEVIGTFL